MNVLRLENKRLIPQVHVPLRPLRPFLRRQFLDGVDTVEDSMVPKGGLESPQFSHRPLKITPVRLHP